MMLWHSLLLLWKSSKRIQSNLHFNVDGSILCGRIWNCRYHSNEIVCLFIDFVILLLCSLWIRKMETENCFHISLTGQIKSCYFPSGFDGHKLFCRYDIVAGADWDLISGMSSGVTQLSRAGSRIEEIVFNMPLEVMYKSTNPFGCKYIT